ncbi:MAG: response regulator [Ardenticatenaceae bacterium]|nr:response regulator [Ardenticatenaceae bacterium]
MADTKQILVVDDAFEMLEFLRSMLQVSNSDHQVLGVPSAEEAWMELMSKTKFDLLITDVRLPGKSGFDLVRLARRRDPDIPVIMITAYVTEQGQKEAEELGVYRYFKKPLDTDSVLTAVQHALYGEPEVTPVVEPVPVAKNVDVELTDEMEIRLDGLRNDTGAFGLLLVAGGGIIYESGGHRDLHPERIAAIVNQKMAHSSMLAEELGDGNSAFNLLYQSGERYELYSVNIGPDYFVTLLFEASARRGRIGTVWVFVQRAVKDLEKILPKLPLATAVAPPSPPPPTPQPQPTPPPTRTEVAPFITHTPPPPAAPPEPEPEPEPEPIQLSEAEMAEFAGLFEKTADAAVDFDAFWDSALDSADSGASTKGGLSLAEAQKMGLVDLPDLPPMPTPEPAVAVTAVAAEPEPTEPEVAPIEASVGELEDLFANLEAAGDEVDWETMWDADLEEGAGATTRGISFEDAVKQGLVPGNFGEGE